MKVLLDADIILEVLLNREIFMEYGENLWELLNSYRISSCITSIGLEKVRIFASSLKTIEAGEEVISELLEVIEVCPVNHSILEEARHSNLRDFESAVELVCATSMSFDAIIAWNPQDFPNTFCIYSVGELLAKSIIVPQCNKYVEDLEKLIPLTNNILMKYTISSWVAYFADSSARLSLVACISENISRIITCTIDGLSIDIPFFRCQEVLMPRLETILHNHILMEITLAIIAQDYSAMEYRICSLRENCESLGIPTYSLPIIIRRMKNVVIDVVSNRRDIIEQPVHTRCILDEYFDYIAELALS